MLSKFSKRENTENKVKKLINKLLVTHKFPQCIGKIDDIHVEITKLDEYYSNYIHRKVYFSLNVQAVCDCKYCL